MKNISKLFVLILTLSFIASGCSKSETYADKLKNERKNINRLLSDKGIDVISSYPSNGVFAENQYFRDPATGVYIHVIDSGNGNRASADDMASVYFRFWDTATLPIDKSTIESTNDNASGLQPVSFTYGNTNSYMTQSTTDYYSYVYMSPGITVPLKYVGEGAIVSLIVPFTQGSGYQNTAYQAIYYARLKYTRIIN